MDKLPYEFDLLYDCKTVEDVRREIVRLEKAIAKVDNYKHDLALLKLMCTEHGVQQ